MSNHSIIFHGTETTKGHRLEVFCNLQNEISISINYGESHPAVITLDKPTAIKLTRVMKSEISKIQKL